MSENNTTRPLGEEDGPGATREQGNAKEDTAKKTKNQEPQWLPVQRENIPAHLRGVHKWVCWRAVWAEKQKRWTKKPFQPNGTFASTTDHKTWATLGAAFAAYQSGGKGFRGVGIVLDGTDGLIGIDIDHCVEDGQISPQAAEIMEKFSTYAEFSPSGTGIRAFCRGKLPPGKRKNGNFEMYDTGRYLTVTGQSLPASKMEICPAQKAIDWFHAEYIDRQGTPPL